MIACFHIPQFGIAVERLRQPDLWGEPLALVNDERRLVAVSDEAAVYGLSHGIAEAGARALCPRLRVMRYDGPAYHDQAEAIWNVYALESSIVEPVSPELCYVQLCRSSAVERTRYLASRLTGAVRCGVQVGLAESKFVALQAALSGKDALMVTVPVGQETARLAAVPVREVPRLDKKTVERLERRGVRTLGDVLRIPPDRWPESLRKIGHVLSDLAVGKDGDQVRPTWPPPSVERRFTFEQEMELIEPIQAALGLLSEQIAIDLIERREYCRSLMLRVTLSDNSQIEECEKLAAPTDTSKSLHRASLRLLHRLSLEREVLSLQLRACDLDNGGGLQLTLLNPDKKDDRFPHEIRQQLNGTISFLRKKFGPAAVFKGDKLPGRGRIGLWTYPLGHFFSEPVKVWTNAAGVPVRYERTKRRFADTYEVVGIQDRWKARDWVWGSQVQTDVYRVLSEPGGLQELQRVGVRWVLGGGID